jgi:hypothetical protein
VSHIKRSQSVAHQVSPGIGQRPLSTPCSRPFSLVRWRIRQRLCSLEPGNRCLRCQVMLDTDCRYCRSAMSVMSSRVATMTALVVLAGRLPRHTQPGGDLGPPDAQTYSPVHQLRECCFCPPLCNPGALDPLQHLGGRHPGSRLRLAWRSRWRLLPSLRLHPLGSRARSALRPSHAIQDAGEV